MAGLQSRIIVHGENFDASGFTDQNSNDNHCLPLQVQT